MASDDEPPPPGGGAWRRKPLWVVEKQAKHCGIETSTGASIELAPLKQGEGGGTGVGVDGWAENEPPLLPPTVTPAQSMSPSHGSSRSLSPPPHLTLFDLVSIGVGGTVGSGIFVLCGEIASSAGPATSISFVISGVAAALSGLAYAELAQKIPIAGSVYAYAYVAIGELAAFISAALLTLEYGISGAAVARSWGEKLSYFLRANTSSDSSLNRYLDPELLGPVNPLAFVVSAASTLVLLSGAKESKRVVNFFTLVKAALVVFMIVMGFVLTGTENWDPFVPTNSVGNPSVGLVYKGAVSSFFGYIGFDEVVCLAGEAINPKRDLAPAVLLTVSIVSILYVLAALALTGMQNFADISSAGGFPQAFRANGVNWAASIAAVGELICLPLVVLICLLAQPRLQQALAQDGLLPSKFATDESGSLFFGTLVAGLVMTFVSLLVPFGYLDDFISSGILVAFCITNNALILLRVDQRRADVVRSLSLFNCMAFAAAFFLVNSTFSIGITLALAGILLMVRLKNDISRHLQKDTPAGSFEVPFVPATPCLAIFINALLIFQLQTLGLALLLIYILSSAGCYHFFARQQDQSKPKWQPL